MEYYSLLIDIRDKIVLVIGKYQILEFKIEKLLEAGAKINYISDLLSPKLQRYVDEGRIIHINEEYNDNLLDDVWLVVCGSENGELKQRIQKATTERHIFCNFVDEPLPSSFISPSVITKGDILISISTKGKSPALNRLLKNNISEFIGDEYPRFAELLGNMRQKILDNIKDQRNRADLFEKIVHNPKILDLLKQNKKSEAEKIIIEMTNKAIKD